MLIRPENLRDARAIESLVLQAFIGHPHHEVGAKPTEHLTVNRLRQDNAMTLALVAENDSGIIGHLAYSRIKINGALSDWQVLAPVSVLPDYQRQGIGSALINQSLALLKKARVAGLVVMGEADYYTRFGFHHQHALTVDGVPEHYFMAQALDARCITAKGSVRFHEAFC